MKTAWLYQRAAWTVLAFALTFQAGAQSFANRELRSMVSADKCVTAPANASDNAQLLLQPCNGSANQRFTLHPDGHLQAGVKNPQGYDLCVDYYPTQGAEGSPVRLFRCRPFGGAVDSHRWGWDNGSLRGAHGTFISPLGGESAASTGSPPLVMSRASGRAQQWTFAAPTAARAPEPAPVAVRAPEPALASVPGTSVKLYSTYARGKCIAPAAGGGLVIWDCVENPNQRFESLPGGYLRQGGKCLASSADTVRFEECTRNATHQQWSYDKGMLRNRNVPAQCLDIERGATDNGTRILAFSCHGGVNQRWSTDPQAVAAVPAPSPSPTPAPALGPSSGAKPSTPSIPPGGASTPDTAPLPSLVTEQTQRSLAATASVSNFIRGFQSEVLRDPDIKAMLDNGLLTTAVKLSEAAMYALTDTSNPYSINSALSNPSQIADLGLSPALAFEIAAEFNAAVAHAYERQYAMLIEAVARIRPEAVVDATPYRDRSFALTQLDDSGMPPGLAGSLPVRELKVKWDAFSRAEKAVLVIQMSRALYFSQEFVKEFDNRFEQLMGNVSKAAERITGDAGKPGSGAPESSGSASSGTGTPGPNVSRILRAVKVLETIAIGAKVARVVLVYSVALWPSEISDYYVDINNQKRAAGSAPVAIESAKETPFSLYLIPQSPGYSTRITREQLINEAVGVVNKFYDRSRTVSDDKASERRIETYRKVMGQLKKRFPNLSKWLDTDYVVTLVQKQKYPAFELNDDRLVEIKSNSPALIEFNPKVRKRGDNGPYTIKGLQPTQQGQTAGYEFALKDTVIVGTLPTLRQIVQASGLQPDRKGVVTVSGAPPAPPAVPQCVFKDGMWYPPERCTPRG